MTTDSAFSAACFLGLDAADFLGLEGAALTGLEGLASLPTSAAALVGLEGFRASPEAPFTAPLSAFSAVDFSTTAAVSVLAFFVPFLGDPEAGVSSPLACLSPASAFSAAGTT